MLRKIISNNFGIFPLILSLIPMHYIMGFMDSVSNVFLVLMYAIIPCVYIVRGGISLNYSLMALLIYLPLTIVLAVPDSVFRSWERYALFLLLVLAVGPIFQSNYARDFRQKLLNSTLVICAILSIGSFFCFFLGINYFSMDKEGIGFRDMTGWFSGLTNQSMILGPISGISAIVFFYLAYIRKLKFCWILFVSCVGSVLFAASRIAFAATIVGLFVVLYMTNKIKKMLIKQSIVLGAILTILFVYWGGATDALLNKHGEVGTQNILSSRSEKITARWDEFCSSPVFGVGFNAIDPNGSDPYNKIKGTIEPGSSWMAILSMTGVIGFAIFITVIYKMMSRLKYRKDSVIVFAILCFFFVHMCAEGYVFAAGNPAAYILWLAVGCGFDKLIIKNKQI